MAGPDLEDTGLQFRTDLEDGVGAGSAVATGRLETPRVEKERRAVPVAGRSVGVSINEAVRLGKQLPEPPLDVHAEARAVGQADGEPAEGEEQPFGVAGEGAGMCTCCREPRTRSGRRTPGAPRGR